MSLLLGLYRLHSSVSVSVLALRELEASRQCCLCSLSYTPLLSGSVVKVTDQYLKSPGFAYQLDAEISLTGLKQGHTRGVCPPSCCIVVVKHVPRPPKSQVSSASYELSHKKVCQTQTSTCRDEILKNQPNKTGTTPQYFYTIPTSCAILPKLCVCICFLVVCRRGLSCRWKGVAWVCCA